MTKIYINNIYFCHSWFISLQFALYSLLLLLQFFKVYVVKCLVSALIDCIQIVTSRIVNLVVLVICRV